MEESGLRYIVDLWGCGAETPLFKNHIEIDSIYTHKRLQKYLLKYKFMTLDLNRRTNSHMKQE